MSALLGTVAGMAARRPDADLQDVEEVFTRRRMPVNLWLVRNPRGRLLFQTAASTPRGARANAEGLLPCARRGWQRLRWRGYRVVRLMHLEWHAGRQAWQPS